MTLAPTGHADDAGRAAAPPAAEPAARLAFELAGQTFAVDVRGVREILDLAPITRLPNAPADLLGMIDVRGEGIAVTDLGGRLGLHGAGGEGEGRILVLEPRGPGGPPVGVIADRVLGVVEIAEAEVEPAPTGLTGWQAPALRGVARIDGAPVLLLALDRLFGAELPGPFDFD